MKKMLKNPAVSVGGLVTIAVIAGVVAWNALDLGTAWTIQSRVDDLVHARNIEAARQQLVQTPRGPTIEALKASLTTETGTPWGKVQVLQLLSQFNEVRAIRRAIGSDVLSTKRGAAYLRQTDKRSKDDVKKVALDWLKDGDSTDRRLAVIILRTTDARETIPDLMQVLDSEGRKAKSAAVVIRVLDALGHFQAEGIADPIMALAKDESVESAVRAEAFRVLTFLDAAPRDELRTLLMTVARDKNSPSDMRHHAVALLGKPQNATEEAWEILKNILFDPDEKDEIFQRTALRSLTASYPLDKLGEVILDRRVYTHRYFGIRTDVASGLGNLRVKSRLALQVLTELLVDDDPRDLSDNVPRQAWISYWMLSGISYGASRPELFRTVPKRMNSDEMMREYVYSIQYGNPAISEAQCRALDGFTISQEDSGLRKTQPKEYERMKTAKFDEAKKISATLRDKIEVVVKRWEDEEKKSTPPPKDPEKKDGD
ncbi:MAG: HEAT repeat domain-containing protein [Planctomycetota bacterium]|jgi:HEAT repeat protein